jgi:type IV pilus assembly protein PilO
MATLTLDDKPWWVGAIVGVVLFVGILWAVKSYVIQPIEDQIHTAEGQIAELDKKIEQGRAAERKLPQFREEVKRLQLELDKLRRILPSSRNTEELIKKIKSLVDQGDFNLHRIAFPRLGAASGADPYAEWPISVAIDGSYHNLAQLFNKLSNYSRIVNVEVVNISALPVQVEKTITVDFIAKTFVYVEPKDQAKPAKPGGK